MGTSKAECKKAYFKLAKKWHPDKHQQGTPEALEAATLKYKEIVAAYDRLMSSDEDAAIEALTSGGSGAGPNGDFGG